MDDIQVIREFKARIQEVYPEADIYFYGSRVTGTHHEDSDYDVLVVLEKVNPGVRDIVYDAAWETGFRYDAFISPVLAEKRELVSLSASPFFKSVTQNGRII
jgi:predicted nucleotidyltransferase